MKTAAAGRMHCVEELDGESSDSMDIDGLSDDANSLQQQQQQQHEHSTKAEPIAVACGGAKLAVLREDPVEEADMDTPD
jgi:hypothetical protein